MKHIIDTIKDISNKISETERKRRIISEYVKNNNELQLMTRVSPKIPNETISAVDGGIVSKSLHGMDIVLIRAGGVYFNYNDGKVTSVTHKPSKFPGYEAHVFNSLSDADWRTKANILRQKMEINQALEILDKQHSILLLDGSVVPHQAYKPKEDQIECAELYSELIAMYKELYKKSIQTGTQLIGVVEDSRSRIFCDMLKQILSGKLECSVLDVTRDTSLLFTMLEKGERTTLFRYSKDPANHPTLSDISEYGSMINSFYLKTVSHDRPLRVDFLSRDNPEAESEEIASVLMSISSHHSGYGIPAPIIEADNISKLSEKEMGDFYSQILAMTNELPDLMKMRREQRPF